MKLKKCCICKEDKSYSEFYTSGRGASGSPKYMSRCKACDAIKKSQKEKDPEIKARIRSYRHKRLKERRLWFTKLKETLSCSSCDLPFKGQPWLCEFHHKDPTQKSFTIGCAPTYLKTEQVILAEISKCDPICPNCHRTHHSKPFYIQRGYLAK